MSYFNIEMTFPVDFKITQYMFFIGVISPTMCKMVPVLARATGILDSSRKCANSLFGLLNTGSKKRINVSYLQHHTCSINIYNNGRLNGTIFCYLTSSLYKVYNIFCL